MNDPRFLPPQAGSKMRRASKVRASGNAGPRPSHAAERGGFAIGLVVGLLIGLAVALGVALYITKAPIPFLNKVQQRTAGQDAAEAERNKNWDPNSPLYGKNPAKSGANGSTAGSPVANTGPSGAAAPDSPVVPPTLPPPVAADNLPAARASATTAAPSALPRDPAAILADKPAAPPKNVTTTSGTGGTDPFTYFVQAGAYGRTEDAEQQRARLAMMGMEGRMSEREQSGRTVYRVRVGPFDSKTDADAAKDRLAAAGVEAALVRVQR